MIPMEHTNGATTKHILNITKSSASRIALAKSDTPDALQKLCQEYWTWHFDESLSEAVRLLLSTELGWETTSQLTTPSVGEVISPLGYALAHEDKGIRDAALQVLDATVHIPAGVAYIGEECAPLEVDGFEIGVYPVTNAQYYRFLQDTEHTPPQGLDKRDLSNKQKAIILSFGLRLKMQKLMPVMSEADCQRFQNGNTLLAGLMIDAFHGAMTLTDRGATPQNSARERQPQSLVSETA